MNHRGDELSEIDLVTTLIGPRRLSRDPRAARCLDMRVNIKELIRSAQQELIIAAFRLDSEELINLILERANAGVNVQIHLDHGQIKDNDAPRQAYKRLTENRINVERWEEDWRHSLHAKVLIADRQFHEIINKALKTVKNKITIIDINDKDADSSKFKQIGKLEYESFLNTGDINYKWKKPTDEWQAISLGYTSGTTGNPKGVVYHHRGSYLMSTGSATAWNMPNRLNFLTVVPMFHCNGWCYPWTVPMLNGKTICLRNIDIKKIFELIEKHNVTHFGGAPIVLNMITGAPENDRKKLKQKIYVLTAGAPPPSIIFKKMKNLGFEVMHVYGLTETYGHVTQCAWNEEWNELDEEKQNEIKARQGVRYPNTEGTTIMDPETMKEVPKDGKTIGEIMIRGNVVMKGYFKDKDATDKAMQGGWFHTGDLAVMHPDGYVKIQDRSKDIIISGGENISSIEIENTLSKHPSVSIAAVVAKPDEKWGEVPCAFIESVKDKPVTEKELIDFCKETLAKFKVPKNVFFCELPKTSTGKIQKFELRKKVKELS